MSFQIGEQHLDFLSSSVFLIGSRVAQIARAVWWVSSSIWQVTVQDAASVQAFSMGHVPQVSFAAK